MSHAAVLVVSVIAIAVVVANGRTGLCWRPSFYQRLWLLFRCLKDGGNLYPRDFDVMVVLVVLIIVEILPVVEDVRSNVMVCCLHLKKMDAKENEIRKNDQKIMILYADK